MKAIAYQRYGGPEILQACELPDPSPKANQLLVQVKNTSVNPIDWKRATGKLRMMMPATFPLIPGYDVAGTVRATGSDVRGFTVGQRVHARIGETNVGACADLVCVGTDVTTAIPDAMSDADAAALPLAGMTALQAVRNAGGVQQGASTDVLVVGASGGVGHFAVQIAKAMQAKVVGVCSTRNIQLVKSLGADDVIDYQTGGVEVNLASSRRFDVIVDCVAGDATAWQAHLKPNGRYVSTVPTGGLLVGQIFNFTRKQKLLAVMLKSNAKDLATLDQLYTDKKLRVVIDSHYPVAQLKAAWEYSIRGRATGKIVVDVGR